MGERICVTKECQRPTWCRDLCQRCYNAAYRRGLLPPRQLELPLGLHAIIQVDPDGKQGTCAVCGRVGLKRRKNHYKCSSGFAALVASGPLQGRKRTAARLVKERVQKYKLSVGEFEAMRQAQDGKCAICGEPSPHVLMIDHCHRTGRVRGLLCRACNFGLGWFRDDPERLRKAAAYLDLGELPTDKKEGANRAL